MEEPGVSCEEGDALASPGGPARCLGGCLLSLFGVCDLVEGAFRTVVLDLWVTTPFGVPYQISYVSDIYLMIHNSSTITVMK